MVYTDESPALVSLKVFVHTQSDRIPLIGIRAFLLDNAAMTKVDVSTLPTDWQKETAYPLLQALGRPWLQAQHKPILKVPSAIIPVEFNYILNPQHPDLKLTLDPPMQFKFDDRMWKVKNDRS